MLTMAFSSGCGAADLSRDHPSPEHAVTPSTGTPMRQSEFYFLSREEARRLRSLAQSSSRDTEASIDTFIASLRRAPTEYEGPDQFFALLLALLEERGFRSVSSDVSERLGLQHRYSFELANPDDLEAKLPRDSELTAEALDRFHGGPHPFGPDAIPAMRDAGHVLLQNATAAPPGDLLLVKY